MPNFITAVLPVFAMNLAHQDQPEGAVALLALALAHPVTASGWLDNWPLLTQLRTELQNILGADAYDKARKRGEGLDVTQAIASWDESPEGEVQLEGSEQ